MAHILAALLVLVVGVRGNSNETIDVINIDSASNGLFSCNETAESCFITVTATCTLCTFECPTMVNCMLCEIECTGTQVCEDLVINSNDCDEVLVTSSSSDASLNGATINGPMSGDLFVEISDTPNALDGATINGPNGGDLSIDIINGGADGLVINGPVDGDLSVVFLGSGFGPFDGAEINTDGTNNLDLNVTEATDNAITINGQSLSGSLSLSCSGDDTCKNSIINCPERNESQIDGPNCFISCAESACEEMTINSVFGTPRDVIIDCGLNDAACTDTFIFCNDGVECELEQTAGSGSSWTCSETTCKTPTRAPTTIPSGHPTFEPTEITNAPTTEPSAMPIDPSSTEAPPMATEDQDAASTTMGATEDDDTTSAGMMTTDDPSLKDGGDKDNEFPVWVGVLIGIFVFLLLVCIIVLGISNRNKEKQQRSGRDLVPTVNEEEVPATSTGASAAETPKNEEEIELATDKSHAPAESGDDLYGDAAIGRSHTRGASEGGDPAVTGTTPAGGEEVQKDDAQIVGMQTAGAGENDKALNMLAGDDEKPANDAEPELQGGDEGPEEDDDDVLDGGITTGGGTGDGGDIGNTGGGDYAD